MCPRGHNSESNLIPFLPMSAAWPLWCWKWLAATGGGGGGAPLTTMWPGAQARSAVELAGSWVVLMVA